MVYQQDQYLGIVGTVINVMAKVLIDVIANQEAAMTAAKARLRLESASVTKAAIQREIDELQLSIDANKAKLAEAQKSGTVLSTGTYLAVGIALTIGLFLITRKKGAKI